VVGDWIEEHLVIPDGPQVGQPYLLTDEMWRHLLWSYRLHPNARPEMGSLAFRYYGALLVRPQKWGKDPFMAAQVCAQALGPVRFAGWDASGEPVGQPVPTPWIQCAGNAEEQTDNTFRPVVTMLREGKLAGLPGLDVGETRVNLPSGGRIEPVTASARARQGARLTFATLTEPHLMTASSGGVKLAKTMKRNLAGMDGRWIEGTNAWDPSERSVAQRTYEAKAPGVYIDYRPPRKRVDLDDDAALRAEVAYVYGDSALTAGGWVREERIIADIRDPATGEGDGRRYFLNEIEVGSKDAVDALRWQAQARPDEPLLPGEQVALGFHGSHNRDATSLVAARLHDGRLFHLQSWERPYGLADNATWKVPRSEVDAAVRNAFAAFDVLMLFGTPAHWQEPLEQWAGAYPKRVADIPTNSYMRMDAAVERLVTAHHADELTHDGSETLTRHTLNAALTNGPRRTATDDADPARPDHYQMPVRKNSALSIAAFVAALLACAARGWAVEHGALEQPEPVDLAANIW
jgi:hypothetical protein